jgi:ABC-type branched-subunit amino acid transport system permease subunit
MISTTPTGSAGWYSRLFVILLGAIIVLAALFKPEMLVGKVGKTKR